MNIVVLGDVLLDVDTSGAARRLSPDGPVPVVDVAAESHRPGGAGLAALLLADAGHPTTLVTVLGDDDHARRLHEELADVTVVAGPSGRPTPVKRRLIADGHVVARMDENCAVTDAPAATPEMLAAVRSADAVLVSDYGRGLTSDPALREALAETAAHAPVVWDPHPRGAEPVPGVAAVTPNLSEARAAAGVDETGTRGVTLAARELLERWPVHATVVTLGGEGAGVFARGQSLPQFIPVPSPTSGGDTCGAGDRFAGALTAQLAQEVPLARAVETAVTDAAAYLARGGVASLGRVDAPADRAADLQARLAEVRARGGTVVATGGCFDLLHAGHARTLAAARNLGDFLVVCLNSDDSVRRLKGEHRPIMQQGDRVELLEALECVDAVVVFEEDTPEAVLSELRPDLWVKGGDYDIDSLPEAGLIRSWGGQAVTVPYHPARSTTRLAEALQAVG